MKTEVRFGDNQLQLTRVFDAPRDLVFGYWKEPGKLHQWFGCADTTEVACTVDFRVGGSFTCDMQIKGAGGFRYLGQYDQIVEPEKIAYHADFGPTTTRVTVEFAEMGAQTKMTLTQVGFPSEQICKMVSQGTSESFDKLDALLAAETLASQR